VFHGQALRVEMAILLLLLMAAALVYAAIRAHRQHRRRQPGIMVDLVGDAPQRPDPSARS
jgi:hypothetical protein